MCLTKTRCGWVKIMECDEILYAEITSKTERICLQELCKASNSAWKRSMVSKRK